MAQTTKSNFSFEITNVAYKAGQVSNHKNRFNLTNVQ